jgi:putative redox protein
MNRDLCVEWTDGLSFSGTNASGQSISIDSNRENGPSPMELMLFGAASCACVDLVTILKKARQHFTDVRVEIGADRRAEHPRTFTDIELHFIVEGFAVKEQYVKRAISLAMTKYCSASAHLAALADIQTSYEIIEADNAEADSG